MNEKDDFELSLAKLFRALWKNLPVILLVFVLTAGAAFFLFRKPTVTTYTGRASFLAPKEYAVTERQVEYSEGQNASDETEKKTVLFSTSIDTYCLVASAPTTLEAVVSRAGLPCTADELAKKLTVKQEVANAYVITVQIKNADKNDALRFAQAFSAVFPEIIGELAPESPLYVLDAGSVSAKTAGGADMKKTLLFAIAAAFITACLIALSFVIKEYNGKNRILSSDLRRLYPQAKILELLSSPNDAAAMKRLRTNLLLALPEQEGCRMIGLTAVHADPAKDELALSLAGSLAEMGDRVLLVDADLRSHRLQGLAKLDPGPGLSELIRKGKLDASALHVVHSGAASFSVLSSGDGASEASELLDRRKILPILRELKADYDYLLLNLESFESSVDASSVGKDLDGTVVAFREEACTRNQLTACVSQMEYAANKNLGYVVFSEKANGLKLKKTACGK